MLAWLLPFFSVLSFVFILCLPYSGLQTLWSTGQASTLMLLLQFGTIILANAAWLDGSKPAFKNKAVDILAKVSLLCLPVYTGLCLYSTGLRIEQYGLSTDRIQALFLVAVTGIWGISYALAVLLRKWPASIGKVNMASVLFMAVIVAAMNSPLLDPYRLAAFNQMQRLQTGEIKPEEFDYLYTRFNLGRYGNQVLRTLSETGSEEIKNGITEAMAVEPSEYANYLLRNVPPISIRREIISNAKVYPEGTKLSDAWLNYFVHEWEKRTSLLRDVQNANDLAFVSLNAQRDKQNLILFTESAAMVYELEPEIKPAGVIHGTFNLNNLSTDVKAIEPKFMDVQIGETVYQILR